MKKRLLIIIPIILVITVIIVSIVYYLYNKDLTTITLDINPSIELKVNKDKNVVKVKALNKEATEIVDKKYVGAKLLDTFTSIAKKLEKKGYADLDRMLILIHKEGNISAKDLKGEIEKALDGVPSEVVMIDNITNEDKKLARKYNITEARAAYINSVYKKNNKLPIEKLINKSIVELNNMKNNGYYCNDGYILDGDKCIKEIEKTAAKKGEVCPRNYYEYNGTCYEESGYIDGENYECREGFTRDGDYCYLKATMTIFGKCTNGKYDPGIGKCRTREYTGDATEICRITPESDMLIDHKCYGPKPTINGGCLDNDVIIGGYCVDLNRYYESDYVCPNGEFTEDSDHKCYMETLTDPESLYCEDKEFKIEGNLCVKTDKEKIRKEQICPTGTTEVDGYRCINMNKTTDKIGGYYCEKDERLAGNKCITYEYIPANE